MSASPVASIVGQAQVVQEAPKRKRGRPKGSKNKPKDPAAVVTHKPRKERVLAPGVLPKKRGRPRKTPSQGSPTTSAEAENTNLDSTSSLHPTGSPQSSLGSYSSGYDALNVNSNAGPSNSVMQSSTGSTTSPPHVVRDASAPLTVNPQDTLLNANAPDGSMHGQFTAPPWPGSYTPTPALAEQYMRESDDFMRALYPDNNMVTSFYGSAEPTITWTSSGLCVNNEETGVIADPRGCVYCAPIQGDSLAPHAWVRIDKCCGRSVVSSFRG